MSELPQKGLARTEKGAMLQRHSEAEVNQALRILALHGGSVAKALPEIHDAGIDVKPTALNAWVSNSFRARYAEIRNELAGQVSESVAGDALENALAAGSVETKAIERLATELDKLDPRDIAPAIRALAQSKEVDVKVAQLLRDRPTEIKETRSVQELMDVINSVPNLIENELPVDAVIVEDEDD